jgi:hypothetical protein
LDNNTKDEGWTKDIKSRFCLDIGSSKGRVFNRYSDISNRVSFWITIIKCQGEQGPGKECEDDDKINKLLSKLIFSLYLVQSKA